MSKLSRKEIHDRINCSSYGFLSYNKEIFFGIIATGIIICSIFTIFAFALCRDGIISVKGGLFLINMLCIMAVSLGIAYFLSQFVKHDNVLTMIANIAGLGMAFLCGIFVPMEFLGKQVIRVAHFLPAYWYASCCNKIDKYVSGSSVRDIVICYGVELLFAAAFIVAGVVAAKFKGTEINFINSNSKNK